MSVDAIFLGLNGLSGTQRLRIPYYQSNNLHMLFDIVGQRYLPIMLHTTPSTGKIFTAVHGEINQNLTVAQKGLLIFHQLYGHENMQWCQPLLRDQKYNIERGEIITETTIITSKNPAARRCTPTVQIFPAE